MAKVLILVGDNSYLNSGLYPANLTTKNFLEMKKTSSLSLSKLASVSNNEANLNKAGVSYRSMNALVSRIEHRKAPLPPRPMQPDEVERLKMALRDYKLDPKMAYEKWISHKDNISTQLNQTKKRKAPPRPVQPDEVERLKMALRDYKLDPKIAYEKWISHKDNISTQLSQTKKRKAPHRPVQPDEVERLKMALRDYKLDPTMAYEKWISHRDNISTQLSQKKNHELM
ncbi:hypothetical protein Pcaca05_12270 [Pectobacterium carotovorum subsp. carotovorum]|nr:hypothetical protein Pcaca05_12270 [Pectobacterium carotovorum subsp. carotovorum]